MLQWEQLVYWHLLGRKRGKASNRPISVVESRARQAVSNLCYFLLLFTSKERYSFAVVDMLRELDGTVGDGINGDGGAVRSHAC